MLVEYPKSFPMKELHLQFPQSRLISLIDIFTNSFRSLYSIILIYFINDSGNEIDLSVARVKSVLDSLEINKAQGPDAINGAVLKNCSISLSYPLHKLFNLAYNTGYLPSEWKLANVVPIHKKDNKNKVVNYRPISLTSYEGL